MAKIWLGTFGVTFDQRASHILVNVKAIFCKMLVKPWSARKILVKS